LSNCHMSRRKFSNDRLPRQRVINPLHFSPFLDSQHPLPMPLLPIAKLWGIHFRPPNDVSISLFRCPCQRIGFRTYSTKYRKPRSSLAKASAPSPARLEIYKTRGRNWLTPYRRVQGLPRQAVSRLWTGRHSMFLGPYKSRRDAAETAEDRLHGMRVEELDSPIINELFREDELKFSYPTLKRLGIQRKAGYDKEFSIENDLVEVRPFH